MGKLAHDNGVIICRSNGFAERARRALGELATLDEAELEVEVERLKEMLAASHDS